MTDKQKPWCLVCFLQEAQENHFPSSLLPIPSPAIKGSRVVSPDALQQKSHVQRTVSLSCAALHYTPFIIINIRSCWNSSCEWKISLFNFQRLPAPLPFASVHRQGLHFGQPAVLWAPSQTGHPERRTAASLFHWAVFQIADPIKLPSTSHNTKDSREAAFFLHAGNGVLLSSSLLERKAVLAVEGAGVKGHSFQLVCSLVSLDL